MRTRLCVFVAIGTLLICMAVSGISVKADDTTYTLIMAVSGSGVTTPGAGDHSCLDGEVVSITASPAEGWQFDNWTGAVADPARAATSVTVSENTMVTANFSRMEYTLTINTSGLGSVARSPDKDTYHWGDVVTLTPEANAGWTFDSFSGDATTGSITMDGDKVVNALFTHDEYTLTMAVAGSGDTTPAVGEHSCFDGEVVDISASPAEGWQFDNWTGAVADPARAATSVTVSENTMVTANFSRMEYTLTMAVTGSGDTTPAVSEHGYHNGDVVTISASPAEGWQFVSWTGAVADPGSAATTIVMTEDRTVIANFSRTGYTLTVTVTGMGSVDRSPDQAIYQWGDVVTLTPEAEAGWTFGGFSGDATANSITMDGNKLVNALFTQDEYTLTMAVIGSGVTAPEAGDHTVYYGESVDITATSAEGWLFDNWTGFVADPASAATTVMVSENMTVTANFSQAASANLVPTVVCAWEQEAVADLESGDPLHVVGGSQINPLLAYGAAKTVDYYAVAADPEDGGDLHEVFCHVFYPQDSPPPYRDGMDPDGANSLFKCKVVYTRIDDPDEAAALIDAARAANLITFASTDGLDGVTGPDGLITTGTAALWVGRGVIAFDEPGGDYTVRVWAVDQDSSRSDVLEGFFNYVPTSGIEVDFTGIDYGSVDLNVERLAVGDLEWGNGLAGEGQANKATVRNIGNTWAHVTIRQDDMGFVFVGAGTATALVSSSPLGAASNWSVNYGVRLGSDDAFSLYYDPNVRAVTPNFLGLSAVDQLDFSILVKNGYGTHNGTITISSTIEPFGDYGAGNSFGPVGLADQRSGAIPDT